MAHKCNYRLLTEKCIITELSSNSSINTFASFSTTGMIAFMNLEVRLRPRVAQSLTEAGRWKKFCAQSDCFCRLTRELLILLIKMKHFDWLSTVQGIHCVFVTDLSLTWSSSFSLKASQLQSSLYWSLEELKGWKATTFAISLIIKITVFYFSWKF